MNNLFFKTLFVIAIFVLTLTGCNRRELEQRTQEELDRLIARGANVSLNCEMSANFELGGCGVRVRGGAVSKPPNTKIDIRVIQIRLQGTGATIDVSNGVATLSLEAAGSVVGAAVFPYSKIGDEVLFNNPDQVNDWINSFTTIEIDGFDLTLGNVMVGIPESAAGLVSVSQFVFGLPAGQPQRFSIGGGNGGGITVTPESL
jgi:hypothetical protein